MKFITPLRSATCLTVLVAAFGLAACSDKGAPAAPAMGPMPVTVI